MIERRRHIVYVSRTGEYHVRDGVCVAVRRRGEPGFAQGHLCEKKPLRAAPVLGRPLSFEGPLATTAVLEVRRPPRSDVDRYTRHIA